MREPLRAPQGKQSDLAIDGIRSGLGLARWMCSGLTLDSGRPALPMKARVPLPTLAGHLKWLDALAWFQGTMERLKAKILNSFPARIHQRL